MFIFEKYPCIVKFDNGTYGVMKDLNHMFYIKRSSYHTDREGAYIRYIEDFSPHQGTLEECKELIKSRTYSVYKPNKIRKSHSKLPIYWALNSHSDGLNILGVLACIFIFLNIVMSCIHIVDFSIFSSYPPTLPMFNFIVSGWGFYELWDRYRQ